MSSRKLLDFLWKHATALTVILVGGFLLVAGFVTYSYVLVTRQFDSARMWDLPSRVYSDATPIAPGQSLPQERLEPKLNYLGYQETSERVSAQGEYRFTDQGVEIYLQDFEYPDRDFHGLPVLVRMRGSVVSGIEGLEDESSIRAIRLEPELITSIFDEVMEDRIPIPLEELPEHLIQAIVATEDRTFFEHEGISLRGIARAAWHDLRNRTLEAGGSTLTQQLVKNLFLTPERTWRRKAIEAVMAIVLEARYSKDEILEAYLNEIYLGQNGSVQLVGVERAAQVYFGKRAENLTLTESATLAGIIRSPNFYSPLRHPERALERRNVILGAMREVGAIDEERYREAVDTPLEVNQYPRAIRSAPFFVDVVMKELRETYPKTQLTTEGFRIFTTLDTMMQREAESSLVSGIANLRKNYDWLSRMQTSPEGVVVTIQPGTGYVKALVGGRDYASSQFNRAILAKRQPGSIFKPFVYVTAMDPSLGDEALTAGTILRDTPITVETGDQTWKPQNYDREFHGPVTVRTALVKSYNIPAVRAAIQAGMRNVIQLASRVGVESRLEPYPSISLGSFEVTPLEIAYAYSVFANEGVKAEPVTILSVVTREGEVLESRVVEMERVAPASVCYVINDILQDVLVHGTAASARQNGFRLPFAGKTGTTNDYRDAWFVGYSPRILTLVWVGFDDGTSLRLSGSTAALPIWTDYMKSISGMIPDGGFTRPDDVVDRVIDPTTGYLVTPHCPEQLVEIFVGGTQPTEPCPEHDAWSGWYRDERPMYDEEGRLLSREEIEERLRRERERRDNPIRRFFRDIFD